MVIMKTTLEIPDELFQRVKLYAVQRRQKLGETITQLLEQGYTSSREPSGTVRPPRPVRLKAVNPPTVEEIERAIAAGRD
jgi:hypothetical protein